MQFTIILVAQLNQSFEVYQRFEISNFIGDTKFYPTRELPFCRFVPSDSTKKTPTFGIPDRKFPFHRGEVLGQFGLDLLQNMELGGVHRQPISHVSDVRLG
jgi:hypothetical protein